MEKISEWKNLAFDTLSSILKDIASALPNILGALIVLLFGWIISKIIRAILKKILRFSNINKVSDKVNEAKLFGDSKIKFNIEKIVLGFVKWVLILVFIIIAADIMKMPVISAEIANLLRYLPILLSAMVIFMIGLFAAKFIKKALIGVFDSMGFSGSKLVSSIVFYIIVIFVTITSLNQAGIDTTLITNNFTLILGAFLAAFALAFGLGSRDVVTNLLNTFYARKTYAIGDTISFGEIKGSIVAIDSLFVTLKTEKGKLVVPIKEIVESRVEMD